MNIVIEGKFVALQTKHDSDDNLDSDVNILTGNQYNNKTYNYEWLANTAATVYVTNQCDAYATYEELPNSNVTGVGKTQVHVMGKGTIYLYSLCNGIVHTLQLNDIFHIPETESNILSIGCWEEVWGWGSLNKYHKVTLTLEDDILIAQGPKIANKLYHLSFALASAPPADSEPEPACFETRVQMLL